ncbi:MAG: hypothetical protein M0R40_05630 [Firmicutes bacterium]|nr:hypothetical protein [Bacillota bacterium]
MFTLLERKLKYVILSVVAFILLILFVLVYLVVSNMMREDFTEKSRGFSMLAAAEADMRIAHMQYTANLFLSRERLLESINAPNRQNNINARLRDIKAYNISVTGAAVYDGGDMVYATDSYYLGEVHRSVAATLKESPARQWVSLQGGEYKQRIVFFIMPLAGSKNGYFAVDVDLNILAARIRQDNIFLRDARIFLRDGSEIIQLDNKGGGQFREGGARHFNIPINGGRQMIEFCIPMTYLNSQLNFFKVLLITAFVVLMIIFRWFLVRFIHNIIASLNALHEKMELFIKRGDA